MDDNLYYYRAKIISVYDGDTVRVDIDLGLKMWVHNEKIRLARINAPELRGDQKKAGLLSRDFLRGLVLEKEVILQTIKDRQGKYGRYLAEIWLKQNDEWVNVNDLLVKEGYAVYQQY